MPGVWRHTSTAHTYVLRAGGDAALLVNVGDGSVLDELPQVGLRAVAAVLTHSHADVAGGAARVSALGVPVYAPDSERPLLDRPQDVLAAWAGDNTYDGRPLHLGVPEAVRTLPLRDYRPLTFGDVRLTPRPAPGPSPGHSTLLCDVGGARIAFTGALLSGAGQVPRLSATMWSYNGGEGLAGSVLSLLDLHAQEPDVLLGAFGPPLERGALETTAQALLDLIRLRRHNPRLLELRARPYEELRPWLLLNRTSVAQSYVIRSAGGRAVLIDFGYDFSFGVAPTTGRDARRPWLYTLSTLFADSGVRQIDAVIPTHAHDDHVAGIGLLRDVQGAGLWAPEPLADVLARPTAYRLPCRWFEPLPPDRVLALEQPAFWEEFRITPYALPGHARHAVAVLVEGHGERVLFTGDQYADADGLGLNYTYQNDVLEGDYVAGAALIARLRPSLLLSGHWPPVVPDDAWLAQATERGEALRRAHADHQPHTSRIGLTTCTVGGTLEIAIANPAAMDFHGELAVGGHGPQPITVPAGSEVRAGFPLSGLVQTIPIVLRGPPGEPPVMTYAVPAPSGPSTSVP
ncbi:hypothetical protein GCM10017781_32240 [Deinococcus metalli]|uniref:Metallo-beta-lactamase domain-containing protein n=1 Tax=Deinococcus metalli TaxID=1141878 RepID=A0ABQ3JUC2_9DEIO|nr:hypothetical protein GCM10017781_32240 [Deinococcus metalli]